jgi:uncharacterized protein YutE (UPF0331/DUF86 family)
MERIYQKIGRINEYLSVIEGMKEDCRERFEVDPLYRGALLYYLYLLADSCISLAEMVIRKNNLRFPQSYQEAFDILGESGVLKPDFACAFAKIAGLRNFLDHDYEKTDMKLICDEALSKLEDVRSFVDQIRGYPGTVQ